MSQPTWFVDTNVLLDYLAKRPGFVAAAEALLEAARTGRLRLCTSGLAFQTVYYLLRREGQPHLNVVGLLRRLNQVVAIQSLDESVVQAALKSEFSDFEDALQYFVARGDDEISAIITRDPRGFRLGGLPVFSPAEALTRLAQD